MDKPPQDDLEVIRLKLEGLQSLLKFQPWAQAVELIEKQCESRSLQFQHKPVSSIDEALVQNYEKGIVAGMRLAIDQPLKMAEILRDEWNAKLDEERASVSY